MQQFIEFVIKHWELWVAFFVILIVFISTELRTKLTGAPQISPQQTTLLINRENAVVIDLREQTEFDKGHIITSKNIPVANLQTKLSSLEKFKTSPIVLAFSSGQYPSNVVPTLKNGGFEKIYCLKGGIPAWINADLPLEKD